MYNASIVTTETECVNCAVQPQSLNITGLIQKNMSWLKRVMAGKSPRRSGLLPRPVLVRLVVVNVTPGQLFLHMLRCFPLSILLQLWDGQADETWEPWNKTVLFRISWSAEQKITFFFCVLKYVHPTSQKPRHSTRPLVRHDPLRRPWLYCTYCWSSRESERGSTPRRTVGVTWTWSL